jgi:hypothetical protein
MHYQHVIALAQLRHEQHQEYARRARTGARRHTRRWRLSTRRAPASGPLPEARETRETAAPVAEAVQFSGR